MYDSSYMSWYTANNQEVGYVPYKGGLYCLRIKEAQPVTVSNEITLGVVITVINFDDPV